MIEDARVEPIVTMVANDNWMEFTVRYVVDYKQRRSTKDLLFNRYLTKSTTQATGSRSLQRRLNSQGCRNCRQM